MEPVISASLTASQAATNTTIEYTKLWRCRRKKALQAECNVLHKIGWGQKDPNTKKSRNRYFTCIVAELKGNEH